MFRTDSKVEKGRVAAHESAESGVEKIHALIDKVAEHAETGSEKATELSATASAKSQDLRGQAADRSKRARKDAKKTSKKLRKNARKVGKKAGSDAADLKDTVVKTAAGLAAASTAKSKSFADEAGKRAPEAFAALKDDHDAQAALDALKGRSRSRGKGWKALLLALVAGGAAAYLAKKKQQGPKKDPWAVPAGDPYKAPESGRASTVGTSTTPATTAPVADEVVADEVVSTDDVPVAGAGAPLGEGDTTHAAMTGHQDGLDDADAPLSSTSGTSTVGSDTGLGETRPLSDQEVEGLASDNPADASVGQADSTAALDPEGDAWSSARDWADESSIPEDKDR